MQLPSVLTQKYRFTDKFGFKIVPHVRTRDTMHSVMQLSIKKEVGVLVELDNIATRVTGLGYLPL